MPDIATRPTFCANAVGGKVLNTGATAEDSMSARRPSATRRWSTSAPMTSPTAMMSAVVSTMMTSMTTSIERVAATSKRGAPNANGVGTATMSVWLRSRLAWPVMNATIVPSNRPRMIALRLVRWKRASTRMMSSVTSASAMFLGVA